VTEDDVGFTIDQLAHRAGTTTRNVRAYQTRGLLPAPKLVGRVGFYDETHLARLRLIARLQGQGFSLAGIEQLFSAWEEGKGLSEVLGFEEALTSPWSDEPEDRVTRPDLEPLLAGSEDPDALIERAVDLRLIIPDGDGYRVPSPRLYRMGLELVGAGIPLSAALDVMRDLSADTRDIAARFVDLFNRYVWAPFEETGMPPERLREVTSLLRRLRSMAFEAVAATLARSMDEAVTAAMTEQARLMEASAAEAS